MSATADPTRYLRPRDGGEQRATNLELFFDLVFVFAITQLSHLLVRDLTVAGAAKTVFLLLVVWWAWIYTTWMTNWFDPDSTLVRLVLVVVMLASLLMAIAIPDAFGDRALLFAGGYVALQVVRNLFTVYATERGSQFHLSFIRIFWWSVFAGVPWIAGALVEGPARTAIWLIALAIDYAGPYARYWTPGFGRSETTDWEVEGGHFAERFQLFIIIALGESIVVTGATAAGLDLSPERLAAIAVTFLTTAAFWWLYFNYVAGIAQRRLSASEDAGRLARDAYTYLHIPIVAGIIVAAVGGELVIAHPTAGLDTAGLVALAAGPVLYLMGHVGFRRRMAGSWGWRRPLAALAIAACGVIGAALPALATAALILAVLVALIVVERLSGLPRAAIGVAQGAAAGGPARSPGEA